MTQQKPDHFIQKIIKQDIASGRITSDGLVTRFPPEPNGYLHIGHAKAICLNFGLAQQFGGRCHLRFDDTNPETAEMHYIKAIKENIQWLGFDWGKHLYYASDYFLQLYQWAVFLIKKNLAFVDDSTPQNIQKMRGSFTVLGQNSPFRNRSIEENLELFEKMKDGHFEDGSKVLRAKINMASGNMNMRDPIMYRILKKKPHPRTGHTWSIYPTYDFAHGQSDAIEKITHSLCTLEFEDHRPLYNWFLEKLEITNPPRQFEFDRLNLDHTILSKRHLLEMVEKKYVQGWDDPRMPTIEGMKQRGYPASVIVELCDLIGVTKDQSTIQTSLLENLFRRELGRTSCRLMAVIDPIKVILAGEVSETLIAKKHPQKPELGKRNIPFNQDILIEKSDFVNKLHKVGLHVRLRYAYVIRCDEIVKDQNGQVKYLKCSYYKETKGGQIPSEDRNIQLKKGEKIPIIHWVSANLSLPIKVYHYGHLFRFKKGGCLASGEDYKTYLNPSSLVIETNGRIEQSASLLFEDDPDPQAPQTQQHPVQFERLGYYVPKSYEEKSKDIIFYRVVALK